MPGPADDGKSDARAAATTWLLGGLGTITALLAALGTGVDGSIVERMERNVPRATAAAFMFCVLAVGFAAVSRIRSSGRGFWLGMSTVSLVTGLLLATAAAAVCVPGSRSRPTLTAQLDSDNGLAITFTVKANGIPAKDLVYVLVDGLVDRSIEAARADAAEAAQQEAAKNLQASATLSPDWVAPLEGFRGYEPWRRLYEARLGPDVNGKVEPTFTLPITPDGYDAIALAVNVGEEPRNICFSGSDEKQGCLVMRLNLPAQLPQLSAQWEADPAAGQTLVLLVKARHLRPTDRVYVRVAGTGTDPAAPAATSVPATQTDPELYTATLYPDGRGAISHSVKIPGRGLYTHVCVTSAIVAAAAPSSTPPSPSLARGTPKAVARTSIPQASDPGCPPSEGVQIAWLKLAAPQPSSSPASIPLRTTAATPAP